MARRRSKKGRRDTTVISRDSSTLSLPFLDESFRLTDFEDRRRFSPDISSFPKTVSYPTKIVAKHKPRRYQHSLKKSSPKLNNNYLAMQFFAPPKVLICARRKIRKEVMHAIGKSGKRGQRRPRRNFYSDIHC